MKWPYDLGASVPTLQADFHSVVAHFERPLLSYLFRFVFQPDMAADLAQETFVKAYQNLHRYDPARRFSTWLFAIASNLAKDHLRKFGHLAETEAGTEDPDRTGEQHDPVCLRPDRQLEASELGQALEHAINSLPLLLREPLLLRHVAGLSTEEAAEALEVSPSVVKVRLFRARQILQELLGKEWMTA